MSHHVPWCGCDPNHLPTHSRGRVAGCKFNADPRELLIKATEAFLNDVSGVDEAIVLLRRWIDLDG